MALSGPGLRLTYAALAAHAGTICVTPPSAAEIVRRARAGRDELSLATLTVFCRLLATAAANAALTFGALGGVYIGGGIVRRFPQFLHSSGFRERFETHPYARSYLSSIATALITVEQPGLFGAYRLLRDHASSAASTP
jgi:glucokinase